MSHEYIRFVPEIGLWSFSRGRSTCRFKTPWCERKCYAQKFYRLGWARDEYDRLDEVYWRTSSALMIASEINGAVPEDLPRRFRFSVKGEIWVIPRDVVMVHEILRLCPGIDFWIPTRAWQNDVMFGAIYSLQAERENARVMCSVDPSVPLWQVEKLRHHGMSIVFTGDNEDADQMLLLPDGIGTAVKYTSEMHRCEKTWQQRTGHCAVCEDGCFSSDRVEVHLKEHR